MVDAGTLLKVATVTGAVATTVGVTAAVAWKFFTAFNSKTDKATTNRMFTLVDEDRKEIAEMGKGMAAMGKDVEHLTGAVADVSADVKEILKNGKGGK